MSTDAAARILDFANPRELRPIKRLCPLQQRRESTSFLVNIEGTSVSKNLDGTVRLQSEKRQEWIREIRGERLQGIAEGTSSASHLASSSAASFPGRNECPGTHCSLREQERWRRGQGGEDRTRVR